MSGIGKSECSVLLAVIGAEGGGVRAGAGRVIPVVMGGAEIPSESDRFEARRVTSGGAEGDLRT